MIDRLRLQEIGFSVFRVYFPDAEAFDPVVALQRHLIRQCHNADAIAFSEKLMAFLVPEVDKLVQSKEITGEEAGDFTAQVLGEIIGSSMAHKITHVA